MLIEIGTTATQPKGKNAVQTRATVEVDEAAAESAIAVVAEAESAIASTMVETASARSGRSIGGSKSLEVGSPRGAQE